MNFEKHRFRALSKPFPRSARVVSSPGFVSRRPPCRPSVLKMRRRPQLFGCIE